MSGEFVDTNVLLYAHDRTAGAKRDAAVALITRLIDAQSGLLSTQVLMEFFVSATRKLPRPLDPNAAAGIVEDFGTWPLFTPSVSDILAAAKLGRRYGIHFWDALIVQGALSMDADILWSEDLNAGQRYAGVLVRNPFA